MKNAVIKFDFDQPEHTKAFEFEDGEFATEQMFVPNGGPLEDDGWVVVQTIDGKNQKGNIVILDAKSMGLLYRGRAPGMILQGLHTGFFSFDQGCSVEDCTPKSNSGAENLFVNISLMSSFLTLLFLQ